MKHVKVLGSGCKNCVNTADLIAKKAAELGLEIKLEKVTDMADIMGYGVMSTPGVVIDEKLVHAGGLPTADAIAGWLAE
jgi:small redox-active disulfide protein 2